MLLPLLLLLPLQGSDLQQALRTAETLGAEGDLAGAVQTLRDAGAATTEDGAVRTAFGTWVMRHTESQITSGQIGGLDAVDAWLDVADLFAEACLLQGAPAMAWVHRAEAMLNAGDLGDAVGAVDEGLGKFADDVDLLMQKGRILMAQARAAKETGDEKAIGQHYAAARTALEAAQAAGSERAAPCERLGELLWTLYFEGGNQDLELKTAAVDAWVEAGKREPAAIDLANMNAWLGLEGLPAYDAVVAERGDDPLVFWYRGMARYAGGAEQWPGIKADFEKVLELNPQFTNAYYFLGDGAMKRGTWQMQVQQDEAKAKAAYRASAGYWAKYLLDFGHDYALQMRAGADGGRGMAETMNWLAGQGEMEDGIVLLDWAVKIVDDKVDYWNNLAFFCRDTGKPERARAAYARAHELAPDDPQIMNDYAVIFHYYLKTEDEKAMDLYQRAIERAEAMLEEGGIPDGEIGLVRTALRDARNNLAKLKQGNRRNF